MMLENTIILKLHADIIMNHETATAESASIPELSRKQLQDLFMPEEDNQWCRLVPKGKKSLECCTPSNSSTWYSMNPSGCEKDVKDYLKKAFEKIFMKRGHADSFWDEFTLNVTHKLGLTYRKTRRLNGTLASYSEAQLQQNILNPILKEVSNAASIIPDIEHETIKTDFIIEDEVEMHEGRSGQKPTVDAMIQVSNKDDKVVACVPVEMKIDIGIKHYSQIACYMNKLSTVEDIASYVMVGVIIDNKQFRLAFSVYCDKHTESVPLPIVHISPPVEWRSDNSLCSIYPQSMLTLACTFLIGQLKRLPFSEEYPTLRGEPSAEDIIEMGNILIRSPHIIHKPVREVANELSLKRQVDKLTEDMKKVKERICPDCKKRKIGEESKQT